MARTTIESATKAAAKDERDEGSFSIDVRALACVVGGAACYAWLFLMLGAVPVHVEVGASAALPAGFIGSLSFLLGVGAALSTAWLFSDFLERHRLVEFGAALVCVLLGGAGLVLSSETREVVWAALVLYGAGFGFLYPLYGELLSRLFAEKVRLCVHGIAALAALACGAGGGALFFVAASDALLRLMLGMSAVALFAYGFVLSLRGQKPFPVVFRAESDSRTKIVWRSYVATATAGLVAGYAFGCLLVYAPQHSWAYCTMGLAMAAACVILLIDDVKFRCFDETLSMRFFLPFAAVVVFPLLFVPDAGKVGFAVALLCGSLLPTTCSISAVCRHISICSLSAVRAFSFGRLMSFLGVAAGLVLSYVGFAASSNSADAAASMSQIASVVVFMLLVILSASFVMTEDNYPSDQRILLNEEGGVDLAGGSPIRKVATDRPDQEGGVDVAFPDQHVGAFRIKCAIVSKRYGLSARQSEVLAMLAKGRNAEYVTEKLVISPHTAKAHIYNIYQKTGVHSRQELMDLVEDIDIADAEQEEGVDFTSLTADGGRRD